MYQPKIENDIRCPLEYGLKIFGGKWNSRVICVLNIMGTMRYGQLKKEMHNITDTVLSTTLKNLIEEDIIERKQYDVIPPKVEYSLTEKGKTVVPILKEISDWSGHYVTNYDIGCEKTLCQKCNYRK